MSRFIGNLVLRSLSIEELSAAGSTDKQLYILLDDLSYESSKLGIILTAPKGMITDFASIPRPVWSRLDPEDPIIAWPSVIHDAIYKYHLTTREEADAVIREAMETQGAHSWIRNAVYWALRAGGSHAWDNPTIYKISL